MQRQQGALIGSLLPKMNPAIADGYASIQGKGIEVFIDRRLRSTAKGFIPGFEYVGMERCTPREQHQIMTRGFSASQRRREIAQSTLYLVKLLFRFNGNDLYPTYLELPYFEPGGMFWIFGTRYSVAPVLADNIFTVNANEMFIWLDQSKHTIKRMEYECRQNDFPMRTYVTYSRLHHGSDARSSADAKPAVRAQPTLIHYLLCRYGATVAFKEFAGADVVVGRIRDITLKQYPQKDWAIFTSSGNPPRNARKRDYTPPDIAVAIRLEQMTELVKSFIVGFFYVCDWFPTEVEPASVDNTRMWMIQMGKINFAPRHDGNYYEGIQKHLESLDGYITEVDREKFEHAGILCTTIYEILVYVTNILIEPVPATNNDIGSVYGKQLKVLPFLLRDITYAINSLKWALAAAADKKVLTEQQVRDIIRSKLKQNLIQLVRYSGHGEAEPVGYPGDLKLAAVTCRLVPQSESSKRENGKKNENFSDPAKWLHASQAEVNGFLHLPKSDPTGRSIINPYLQLSANGDVLQDPKLAEVVKRTHEKIAR